MDYDLWLNKAKKKIENLSSERQFLLKELFQGTEWNELSRGEKLSFGRYFKNAVNDGTISDVFYIGKADNNSAKYKKC